MRKLFRNISILQFHNITEKAEQQLWLPLGAFREYLSHLGESGFEFLSIEEALHTMGRAFQVSRKRPISLTFDHGYADFYTNVFPLLAERGISGTVLISPDKVGAVFRAGGEKLHYLSKDQLKEISKHTITVGAYEDAAWDINNIDPNTVSIHIREYKPRLEDILGREVKYFGVKEGSPSRRIRDLLIESGYDAFLTQCPTYRRPDPYAVGRIQVDDDDFNIFLTKISRTYLFFKDKKSWRYIRKYKLDRVAHRVSETVDRIRGKRHKA